MVIHLQLAKKTLICVMSENAGPFGQKCIFFILFGFNDNKVLLEYFKYSCSVQEELTNNMYMMTIQQLSQIWQVKTLLLHLIFGQTIKYINCALVSFRFQLGVKSFV